MPTEAEMQARREAIKVLFRDPAKVNDMPDHQVTAIWIRAKNEGKIK